MGSRETLYTTPLPKYRVEQWIHGGYSSVSGHNDLHWAKIEANRLAIKTGKTHRVTGFSHVEEVC